MISTIEQAFEHYGECPVAIILCKYCKQVFLRSQYEAIELHEEACRKIAEAKKIKEKLEEELNRKKTDSRTKGKRKKSREFEEQKQRD